MDEKTPSAEPSATSLKKELQESLKLLRTDFEGLKHFVEELSADGVPASIKLTKDDLHHLLSITQEIHDAANDIEFEASKIKEKLSDIIV